MKKNILLKSLAVLAIMSALSVQAVVSVTYILLPNGMTNTIKAPGIITSAICTANGTNSTLLVLDAPTNKLSFTNGVYTNTLQYATNSVFLYTNFYGATNTYTNLTLVTATNTVAAATNNYPAIFNIGAAAGTSTILDPTPNYFFGNGVLITNNSSGTATITITYSSAGNP